MCRAQIQTRTHSGPLRPLTRENTEYSQLRNLRRFHAERKMLLLSCGDIKLVDELLFA